MVIVGVMMLVSAVLMALLARGDRMAPAAVPRTGQTAAATQNGPATR